MESTGSAASPAWVTSAAGQIRRAIGDDVLMTPLPNSGATSAVSAPGLHRPSTGVVASSEQEATPSQARGVVGATWMTVTPWTPGIEVRSLIVAAGTAATAYSGRSPAKNWCTRVRSVAAGSPTATPL